MAKKRITTARVAKKLGLPRKPDRNQVFLSNGTRIRLSFFAPQFYQELLRDAMERWPEPEAPIIHVEAFDGAHDEANPNDPDYLKRVDEQRSAQGRYVTDALLLLGVDCDVPAEWKRRMEKVGKTLPKDADELKLYYLKNFALTVGSDYTLVLRSLARGVMVTDEGVAEAAARFKSDLSQPTDHGLPTQEVGDTSGTGVGDGRDGAGVGDPAGAVQEPVHS